MKAGICRCNAVDAGRCTFDIKLLQPVLSIAAQGLIVADSAVWGSFQFLQHGTTEREYRLNCQWPVMCVCSKLATNAPAPIPTTSSCQAASSFANFFAALPCGALQELREILPEVRPRVWLGEQVFRWLGQSAGS